MARGVSSIEQKITVLAGIINQLANEAENHLAQRLIVEEPNRLATFRIESEIVEYLKRVYYFAKRIARVVVKAKTAPVKRAPGSRSTLDPASDQEPQTKRHHVIR